MVDTATRTFLLLLLAATLIRAIVVWRHTRRPSRRGAIIAMIPTLIIWIVFEAWLLHDGDLDTARWLSRLGLISLTASFLFQLWSIDYSERAERRIRDNGI